MFENKEENEKAVIVGANINEKYFEVKLEELKELEKDFENIMTKWKKLMLEVPNIPDISVPDGETDADNQEIKIWGEKTKFDFMEFIKVKVIPVLLTSGCIYGIAKLVENLVK